MTTSAPIRKVHNVPIVVVRPRRAPRELPAPSPAWETPIVVVPTVPVKEPVRR